MKNNKLIQINCYRMKFQKKILTKNKKFIILIQDHQCLKPAIYNSNFINQIINKKLIKVIKDFKK